METDSPTTCCDQRIIIGCVSGKRYNVIDVRKESVGRAELTFSSYESTKLILDDRCQAKPMLRHVKK